MKFINKMEHNAVQMKNLVNAFKFLSDNFQNKIHQDYSYLIKDDKELYFELQSMQILFCLMEMGFDNLYKNFQCDVNSFYENLN